MKITEKQSYEIRYLVIPDFVFNNRKLTRLAVELYSFIHGYRAPEFFFSNEKLAELFQCDERSIRRAISQLTEEGYVSWEQPDGRKRFITDLWVDNIVLPGGTNLSSPLQADGRTDVSSPNVPNEGSNRRENDEISNPNKNIFNKNNLAKIGDNLTPSQKRELKEQRRRASGFLSQGRGFPPKVGSTPRYEKKERTGVHAEDVV